MKLKQFNKAGVIYAVLCPLLAAAGAVFNYLLLKYHSDVSTVTSLHQTVLYQNGAPRTAFIVLAVISAAALFSAIFVFRKTVCRHAEGPLRAVRFFAVSACAVALIFIVPLQFILKTADTPYELTNDAFSLQNSSSAQKVCLVLAVFGAAYFLLQLFFDKSTRGVKIARTALGLALVFFLCGQLLVTHNYMKDFLGSPARVLGLTSLCFLVFFLLSELRTGLPGRVMPGAYAATGLLALYFTAIECIPSLILSLANTAGYKNGIGVFYLLLKLFIGVYAYISVCPTLLYKDAAPQPAPAEPSEPASEPEPGTAEPEAEEPEAEEAETAETAQEETKPEEQEEQEE